MGEWSSFILSILPIPVHHLKQKAQEGGFETRPYGSADESLPHDLDQSITAVTSISIMASRG